MTEERFGKLENRVKDLEDSRIRNERIAETLEKIDGRIEILEKHDEEFMLMVHSTCTLKDKEIAKSRDEAIKISTDHANDNHKQTLAMIVFMFTLFIGAVVFFNVQNSERAVSIERNNATIEAITHSLDKIDNKIDSLSLAVSEHKISDKSKEK